MKKVFATLVVAGMFTTLAACNDSASAFGNGPTPSVNTRTTNALVCKKNFHREWIKSSDGLAHFRCVPNMVPYTSK